MAQNSPSAPFWRLMWFQPSRKRPATRAVARRLVIMSSRQIAFGPIPLLPHHARFGFAAYTRREATSDRRLDGADVSCITNSTLALVRGSVGEPLEGRRRRSALEPPPYRHGAFLRAQQRGVDLEVVDPGDVDRVLPAADRGGDRVGLRSGGVLALASGLAGVASLHDDLDRAADSDE